MPATHSPGAPAAADCAVVELRQYTLRPGRRDDLVTLFDREFVETQEAVGMKVLGQFRDLGSPDRFVWLRGFADMESRRRGLQAFYGGPVWERHGPAANATMLDSDDVLLLRPAWRGSVVRPREPRPPRDATTPVAGLLDLVVFPLREPASAALLALARERLDPCLTAGGAQQTAWYVTDPSPNDFPRLPVREDVQVLVGIALFEDQQVFDRFVQGGAWAREAAPLLAPFLAGPPQALRLAPTARSALRS
jgi:hypothetical protein